MATATIANNANLSEAVTLGGLALLRISMPSAWTTASLTFQGSEDGTTFNDLYDDSGTEVAVAASASRCIVVDPTKFISTPYLKVRSGTSASPVSQGGARTLTLGLRSLA